METDAALSKSFVLLIISLKCRGLNFPYLIPSCSLNSVYNVGKHRGRLPLSLCLFTPSDGLRLAHICPSVCLGPSRAPRPLTILQRASCQLASALNPPPPFAPSACCQNCPHQSGTAAPWTPVPIRLSSGALYPFALLFCGSLFGLTFPGNLLAPHPSATLLLVRPCSSSFRVIFVFIRAHVGSAFISNHTLLRLRPVFMWVFNIIK